MKHIIVLRQNYLFRNGIWRFSYKTQLDFIPQIGAVFGSRPRFDGPVTNVLHFEVGEEFIHTIDLGQCDDFRSSIFNSNFLVEWEEFGEFRRAQKSDNTEDWTPKDGFTKVS